ARADCGTANSEDPEQFCNEGTFGYPEPRVPARQHSEPSGHRALRRSSLQPDARDQRLRRGRALPEERSRRHDLLRLRDYADGWLLGEVRRRELLRGDELVGWFH